MQNFQLGPLDEWHPLDLQKGFVFACPQPRRVAFELMLSDHAQVFLIDPREDGEDIVLCGVGEGHLAVSFTSGRDVGLQIAAPDGTACYIRTRDASQVVEPTDDEAYTRLHVARPQSEVERMMHFARLNAMMMEQRLASEIRRFRDDIEAGRARADDDRRADGSRPAGQPAQPADSGDGGRGGAQEPRAAGVHAATPSEPASDGGDVPGR
jgi:hypothetical protein